MFETAASASRENTDVAAATANDDVLTMCAVAVLAFILSDVLCEGGRAAVALLTISPVGRLSSIGWTSAYDNMWVDASGAAISLLTAVVFWFAAHRFTSASLVTRLFLILTCAFSALSGAGYFLMAGLTDFGDWYTALQGLSHWSGYSLLLTCGGVLLYAVALYGIAREFRPFADRRQVRRILRISWRAAIVVYLGSAALNPGGVQELALSSLPMTTISDMGLLFVFVLVPKPWLVARDTGIRRNYGWIGASAACTLVFILVLGSGLILNR